MRDLNDRSYLRDEQYRDGSNLNARVTCTDLSPGMLSEARSELAGEAGFGFAAADAQTMPFPNNRFDVVLANFMLYRVPDSALTRSQCLYTLSLS